MYRVVLQFVDTIITSLVIGHILTVTSIKIDLIVLEPTRWISNEERYIIRFPISPIYSEFRRLTEQLK